MGSLIKVVASGCRRLPLINSRSCVISSSRALAATHEYQRCFFSTVINDNHHGHGLKHNLQRARNKALNSVSNFIYTNIMNRFGLFSRRAYCIGSTEIEPSMSQETDEYLCYHLQMNGVISHDNVSLFVSYNFLYIKGVVYDEFKATPHVYVSYIYLPEDSYYLNYKMRGIKADFSEGGALKLTVPKFDAAERMMNQKKDAAGEFSKLKMDAFIFDIKVNAAI